MARSSILVILAFVALAVAPSQAQTTGVGMTFDSGRVTIVATDVAVSDVLKEWARAGGTSISGAEMLPPARVTLKLVDAPEVDALQAILGASGGYLFTRHTDEVAGRSQLRSLAVAPPGRPATRVAATPQAIDETIPEARFQYPAPMPEATDAILKEREDARMSAGPPLTPEEAKIIPEARYQYVEPGVPDPPSEDATGNSKPDPKTKKPPSGN